MLNFVFSFIAGLFSTLSPCVLPILPVIITSSLQVHKKAIWFLGLGLVVSYSIIGFLLASFGNVVGLSAGNIQFFGGIILILLGVILFSQYLNDRFSYMASILSSRINFLNNKIKSDKTFMGQFLIGVVLGAIWTPCVGPTLGAAIVLASQGESLVVVFLTMLFFSLGAVLPLIVIGLMGGKILLKNKILVNSSKIKKVLGVVFVASGLLMVSGYHKKLETYLLSLSPDAITELTVKF